ncbi:MAG: STAS/SEC14 domain-containing protein [Sphingomonas sp.]
MFNIIEDLEPGILGIEAVGKITHEDYRDTLIPTAEAMMRDGPIKVLCVIRSGLTDFALEAMWDDQRFGFKHWHDISHFALVSDHAWIRVAANLFTPFYPAKIKLFRIDGLAAAKEWITCAP